MANRRDTELEPRHGKKPNQKLKPYLVLQYLLRETDENHVVKADDIVVYLQENGIDAERRSIYRDIEEINKANWMIENGATLQEAEEAIKDEQERLVIFDRHRNPKGFYVRQRHYDLNDIRLLAECVYAAKFIPQGQADRLVSVIGEFVSKHQAEKIRNNALVINRVKTLNKGVLNNISVINDAMARMLDGEPHTPEKISFSYLTHEMGHIEKPVERRRKYIVSPYYLVINDGNYYLLGYDDKKQDICTFRVDRMKSVSFTEEPREGAEAFADFDADTYMQRVFSMYGGERKRVKLRFINPLLDTALDRFGTKGVIYEKADSSHFYVTADIEVSDQFFAWICGFGKRIRIETPNIAALYADFLDKIRKMY